MKDHLNIFEYYSQKGVLPIENNSTRNLGIVIKNNSLTLFGVLDLISQKIGMNIIKPTHPDEWFLKLQVKIKNFANEDIALMNIIAITLTTKKLDFYGEENRESKTENITDMLIYSNGTLLIIEAKRNSADATKQLKRQIAELQKEWSANHGTELPKPEFFSITWDSIVECFNNINTLTNGSDIILDNYLQHIKTSVASFFPVQPFSKINCFETDHIIRRIERFADNYGAELNIRRYASEPYFWIKLTERPYVRELAFRSYNDKLHLFFSPGNTVGQGHSLFNDHNKLSLLSTNSISVQGYDFSLSVYPKIKISDAYARHKFDMNVDTKDKEILTQLFTDICGRKNSANNVEFLEKLKNYKGIVPAEEFVDGFKNSFVAENYDYTFLVSLTLAVYFENIFEVLKKIDTSNNITPDSDMIVKFTKEIEHKIYDLIEN